jgi:hypothetical protein
MSDLFGAEMKLSYSEQLKHPNWQRRRLEVMSAARFECANCGDKESMLHVHHKRYIKGRLAWEYSDDELMCLCEGCHGVEHDARDFLETMLAAGDGNTLRCAGLFAGYMQADEGLTEQQKKKVQEMAMGLDWLAGAFAHMVLAGGLRVPSDKLRALFDGVRLNQDQRELLDVICSLGEPAANA